MNASRAVDWLEVDSAISTQDLASDQLAAGNSVGVVYAEEQVGGRGRFGRFWHSDRGDSLTASIIFREYADHPKPYLIGMSVAVAAASALHVQLRWPNDLVVGQKKVGGILTELIPDEKQRRVPVVGLGINLNQRAFPAELAEIATSLALEHGTAYEGRAVLRAILNRLEGLPEPEQWGSLAPVWSLFDRTPGKSYRLTDGSNAVAIGIGSDGQLMCSVEGESRSVLAAEAVFGAT